MDRSRIAFATWPQNAAHAKCTTASARGKMRVFSSNLSFLSLSLVGFVCLLSVICYAASVNLNEMVLKCCCCCNDFALLSQFYFTCFFFLLFRSIFGLRLAVLSFLVLFRAPFFFSRSYINNNALWRMSGEWECTCRLEEETISLCQNRRRMFW